MELRFGNALREDFESFWLNIEKEFISRINVLPLGPEEAIVAGDILADLQKRGQPIGIEDMLIHKQLISNKIYLSLNFNLPGAG